MFRNAFVLISLFSYSFLIYLPLNKIEIGLDNDDICHYLENSNNYVKACDKGYYCNIDSSNIGICQEYKPAFKNYKEECKNGDICSENLACINNICLGQENHHPYNHTDPFSRKTLYYCSDETIPILSDDSDQTNTYPLCKKNNDMKDKCKNGQIEASPDYMKVCGKVEISNLNEITSISSSEIGFYDDGTYVKDELACKSGFALSFYADKSLNGGQHLTKLCATFLGAEKSNPCIIRYSIGDGKEYIYNENLADQNIKDSNNLNSKCGVIGTKVKIFEDFLKKYNELKIECQEKKYYNEPFTCQNDELRKLWYYYNNPKEYLLYRNDEEIFNYLIEQSYTTSKSMNEEKERSSSCFFNIKYFLILLLLLF